MARRLADGRAVRLVGDRTHATRDRYGRLLAYVWIRGGGDLGYQQLLHGFARVYVTNGHSCAPPPTDTRPASAAGAGGASRALAAQPSFVVLAPDPHRFDGDGDGVGCEG